MGESAPTGAAISQAPALGPALRRLLARAPLAPLEEVVLEPAVPLLVGGADLDGRLQAEISGQTAAPPATDEVFIAGRNDGRFNFEGRIDEVAVYLRSVTAEEVQRHYRAATGDVR